MTIVDLMETDAFGYACVPEARLSEAFAAAGKGLHVPQTCLPPDVPLMPETLANALGRPPSEDQWVSFVYRWCGYTEQCSWGYPEGREPDAEVMPLPGSMLLAFCAFAILLLRRRAA